MLKGGRSSTASGLPTTSVITSTVKSGLDLSLAYGFDWTCTDPHLKTGCAPDSTTDNDNYAYVGSNEDIWT